jgi:hypothetical protein
VDKYSWHFTKSDKLHKVLIFNQNNFAQVQNLRQIIVKQICPLTYLSDTVVLIFSEIQYYLSLIEYLSMSDCLLLVQESKTVSLDLFHLLSSIYLD